MFLYLSAYPKKVCSAISSLIRKSFIIFTTCALMIMIVTIFYEKVDNVALKMNVQGTTKANQSFISKPVFEEVNAIVVPKYKLIFFWHAKTACSYWKRVFQFIQGIPRGKYGFYLNNNQYVLFPIENLCAAKNCVGLCM